MLRAEPLVLGSAKAYSRARIGILGKNKKDCANADFRVGFGTGGYVDGSNTCGNDAIEGDSSDNGEKHIKAIRYILVKRHGNL